MDSDAFRVLRPSETDASGIDTKLMRASVGKRLFNTAAPTIGRFRVLGVLGEGAMGTVYEAYDLRLDRRVAVKVLRTATMAAEDRDALLREARALARLTAPEVVTVFEADLAADVVFIAMEFLDGGTLRELIARSPVASPEDVPRMLDVLIRAGRGIEAAHAAGLVHRDFKPGNVLLGRDGRVKVADFGLARSIETTTVPASLPGDSEGTAVSTVAGTPGYIAPEARRGLLDARSDQFSFCVSAWEALFSTPPFERTRTLTDDPRLDVGPLVPASHHVPARVMAALTRGLSSDPDARFPSMTELLAALSPRPRVARARVAIVAGSITAAAMAIYAGARAEKSEPCARAPELAADAWSSHDATTLREQFAASGLAFADQASRTAIERLDAQTSAWIAAHTEACRATRVDGHQSDATLELRMTCLDDRKREIEAVATTLADADALTIERTGDILDTLSSIDRCADVERLDRGPRAPTDPVVRKAADALRGELVAIRAQAAAGDYASGERAVDQLVARARELEHDPTLADALETAAAMHSRAYESALAESYAREAIVVAARAGIPELELDAWMLLLFVFPELGEPLRGLDVLPAIDAAIARAADPLVIHRSHRRVARFLIMIGRLDEAEARLVIAERTVPAGETSTLAEVYDHRARLELARGNLVAAREMSTTASMLKLAEDGPAHPDFAATLTQQGIAESVLGYAERARDLFQLSFDIVLRTYGPDHASLIAQHGNLAVAYERLGDIERARTHSRETERISMRHYGAEHLNTARIWITLARLDHLEDDFTSARAHLERALRVAQDQAQADDGFHAAVLEQLGNVDLDEHAYTRAVSRFSEALAIRERAQSKELRVVWLGLARARIGLGETAKARPLLEQVVDDAEANDQSWPGERFVAELQLARLDAAAGDREGARARLESARAKAQTLHRAQYERELDAALADL